MNWTTDIRPIDDPEWLNFATSHPQVTPFHLPPWASTLEAAYGFDIEVWLAFDGDQIAAGLPVAILHRRRARWGVALPFTDECPPLSSPAGDASVA